MMLATLLLIACGQVYRPVVIPCSEQGIPGCPVEYPPTPANFHAVFAISTNAPNNPGGALQIDVSGDSIIAETPTSNPSAPNVGDVPTHAAILPNNSRVFVASAGSVAGGIDGVSSFTTAVQAPFATGFGPVTSPSLPSQQSVITAISEAGNLVTVTLNTPWTNVAVGYAIAIAGVSIPGCQPPACNPSAYDGGFTLASISGTGTTIQYVNPSSGLPALSSGGTATFPPQPVFVNSTQNNAMYVANYNSNSVFALNISVNAVTNTASVGVHPVSLAELPNGTKLYVANQGTSQATSSVSSLNVADLSSNPVTGFTGTNPVWIAARGDSQKIYVLTQGDGQLVTIDTATDTVSSSLAVGAGANFIFFDPNLNRLYVTNPQTSTVYVFSDTGGAGDTPLQLAAISFAAVSTPCPLGCAPTSITALADGTRFYVASYQTAAACPQGSGVTGACVIPGLTVFNANSLSLQYPSAPTLTLLSSGSVINCGTGGSTPPCYPFAAGQYAVPPVAACVSPVLPTLYTPGVTRFRIFTTASMDSSHVYVSMCDAGYIADIITTGSNTNGSGSGSVTPDTLVTDLPTAFGAGPIQANGYPANQNPIFMMPGQ
ncbi:MAG: YncE family protein [Candidatus Sulfotelmatobacter sp.]